MDARDTEKARTLGAHKTLARETRLAQALRTNLRRRKTAEARPTEAGAREAEDGRE